MSRTSELAANLHRLEQRLNQACAAAGRAREELTVVAVTKTFPVEDIRRLAGLGIREVGENRDQEAREKHNRLQQLGLRWHFIGSLQRNKCRSVVRYADLVHSVDRPELVGALDGAAGRAGRVLQVLIQVNLDPEPTVHRSGAAPDDVAALAEAVAAAPALSLRGLMGVAPRLGPPGPAFSRLRDLYERMRMQHPGMTVLSAGMSGDLEAAVEHGATLLRVGSALLGRRSDTVR